jgi:hypothetical protein
MNVEIGTEATQFPEKEYVNAIFLAVWQYCLIICLSTYQCSGSRYFDGSGPTDPYQWITTASCSFYQRLSRCPTIISYLFISNWRYLTFTSVFKDNKLSGKQIIKKSQTVESKVFNFDGRIRICTNIVITDLGGQEPTAKDPGPEHC